jgi:hypothetical protein
MYVNISQGLTRGVRECTFAPWSKRNVPIPKEQGLHKRQFFLLKLIVSKQGNIFFMGENSPPPIKRNYIHRQVQLG